ncbi:hypothetical protein ACWOAH_00685 [Vagococcus vulneris]|uniref:Uncharacterized protein n=1 Tax=Vagococcus vulneris TaxID=1977869 RepID=A0A430A297_9ENTE|nr:hypothetical protein [Vagococcus vulneris]RSU00593.1 hypothetical protein CBF37_00855 [Vagococcus vulneris]
MKNEKKIKENLDYLIDLMKNATADDYEELQREMQQPDRRHLLKDAYELLNDYDGDDREEFKAKIEKLSQEL